MWDVFKVRRMMMMFAGYCVCGAGTKQDILHGVLTVGQCGPINTHPGGQLFIKIELFWGRNPLKAKRIFEGKWIF